jgi:hypothetical protein
METEKALVVEENKEMNLADKKDTDMVDSVLQIMNDKLIDVASSLSNDIKNSTDIESAKRSSFVSGYACGMADVITVLNGTREQKTVVPFAIRTMERFNKVSSEVLGREMKIGFELTQE